MLVGSGGVVALVLGAWSVLWIVRICPERGPGEWWPTAAAFVAAMFAFALLSGQTEVVEGSVDWSQAAPTERADVAALAMSYSLRPLLGAILGTLSLVIAALVASRQPAPPTRPEPLRPGRGSVAALIGLAVLTAFGLLDLALMRHAFERVAAGDEALVQMVPRLQLETTLGAIAGLVTLFVAAPMAAIGAWRSRLPA
jgi:hypothetical protein